MLLNCGKRNIDLSHPVVMGILNITPNSFSSVGRFAKPESALRHAIQMVNEGAAIIDVGGEPTNPGVYPIVSLQEELDRVLPVIELLKNELSVAISVDTSKPEVMREAIRCGVHMINDVRALRAEGALAVIAEHEVAVCLMHMAYPEGVPNAVPLSNPADIVQTVKNFLHERVQACQAVGISLDRIMIDPGIGHGNFGKNLAENLMLLKQLPHFLALNLPLLVGVSRKTFIGELLNLPPEERLSGSLAATAIAIMQGANIIRTHDVRATVEAVKVAYSLSIS